MYHSNKSSILVFLIFLGLFAFLSMESLGVTHLLIKEQAMKQDVVLEAKDSITV